MPVLTSGSPLSLHSLGTSLYYSLLCLDQCLSLPKDLSACRLQFILHRTRRIFLKGGGEVSDLIITTNGAQGHKPIQSHTQAFLKSAPAYLLNSRFSINCFLFTSPNLTPQPHQKSQAFPQTLSALWFDHTLAQNNPSR